MDIEQIRVFLGVDIAKEEHYCHAAAAAGGAELFARAVPNNEAGLDRMIDQAETEGRTVMVIDTTSSSAGLLLGVAARRGIPVAYVPGLVMRRAADLYAGAAKTDPRDAFVLADYARRNADRLNWVEVTDELMTRMRILAGRDEDLATDSTRGVNRLRDALLSVSPGLERVLGPKLGQKAVRELLRRWPTPTALRTAGRTRIRNLLKKHYPRKPQKALTLTQRIWAETQTQTVTLPGEATWGEVITELTETLDRTHTQRADLAARIEQTFGAHPLAPYLLTVPGIGTTTGARLLTEIGNPHRFANGSRLASYAGLAPVTRRSGRTINNTRSNPAGNHRLKNAMYWTAFSATQHDPHAQAYYQRKRAEGKHHTTAVISVARRRCDLILAILKNQTPYNPPPQPTPTT